MSAIQCAEFVAGGRRTQALERTAPPPLTAGPFAEQIPRPGSLLKFISVEFGTSLFRNTIFVSAVRRGECWHPSAMSSDWPAS